MKKIPQTLLAFFLCAAPVCGQEKPSRPNILLLVTDDQRADCLSCAGHPLLKTPHIDALARDGVRFRNAFVTTAICCVSRASIFTGQLARHHKVPDFQTPFSKDMEALTFFSLLRQYGYFLGCFGKWGIGGPAPTELFDVWDATGGQGPFFQIVDGEKVHNSEWLSRKSVEFLKKCPADRPFCLLVLYKSPHEPYTPDPRDAELFKDQKMPLAKTATPEHLEKVPAFLKTTFNRTWAERDIPTPEKHQEFIRQYLRCIAGVDRSVGKIVGAVAEQKKVDNTLIMYSSDHGMFLGEHGFVGKWIMHEESIRVPFIVKAPGIQPALRGKTLDQLALNIDLAPTILDYAGAKVPAQMDGASLKPLLLDRPTTWRKHFFYEHHFHVGGKIARTEGVRSQDWSYMTYFDVKPAVEELYDLRRDGLQENNLARDMSAQASLDEMRGVYRQYLAKLPGAMLPTEKKKKAK